VKVYKKGKRSSKLIEIHGIAAKLRKRLGEAKQLQHSRTKKGLWEYLGDK